LLNKLKNITNIRAKSVRKKTAARIAAVQVLYSYKMSEINLENAIDDYMANYQKCILKELDIKYLDLDLFNEIILYVRDNIKIIDSFISNNLSKKWKLERLSLTELNIIRLSVYELCVSSRFNSKTIINEYISIFETFSGNVDFANGILDGISKKRFDKNNE